MAHSLFPAWIAYLAALPLVGWLLDCLWDWIMGK